jgi:hypothetical protein
MPRPFYHEGQVEIADGEVLNLVLDFRAIDIIENLTKLSMDQVLQLLASDATPDNLACKMLWAMARENHSSMTLNEAMSVVVDRKYGPAVGLVMADMLNRAYDLEEKAKEGNPPRRRGRSNTS